MKDPGNFLSRWSRRKREAGAPSEKTDGGEATAASTHGGKANPDNPNSEPAAPPVPEFDVSKLPPIESIGAGTDISAFMQTGVPSALRHAALRRAWSADPAIRDFMGPTENYWDAAGPDGVPGFGDLNPNLDVKRMVAELFGEAPPVTVKPDSFNSSVASAPIGENSDDQTEGRVAVTSHETLSSTAEGDLSHRTENGAAQNNAQDQPPAKKMTRRHGGAMPE
jgi:hypothetical protein